MNAIDHYYARVSSSSTCFSNFLLKLIPHIVCSSVLSHDSKRGLTGNGRRYTGTLRLKNWLCKEFPDQNAADPAVACWYYEDDRSPVFLPCTRATVDELEKNFNKNQGLDISQHKFEMPIPIPSLSHQHWIFEAISTHPTYATYFEAQPLPACICMQCDRLFPFSYAMMQVNKETRSQRTTVRLQLQVQRDT